MVNLTYTVDFKKASDSLAKTLQDAVASVIPEQLEVVRDIWSAAVQGVQLPGMVERVNSPVYASALEQSGVVEYPWAGNPLWGRVVVRNKEVSRIEHGRLARDMKPQILAGPKAKRNKQGQRYNVIPLGFKALKPGAFSPGFMAGMFHATAPFRTVSDKSPANSWIYPAAPGAEVALAVKAYVQPLILEAIQERVLQEWRR